MDATNKDKYGRFAVKLKDYKIVVKLLNFYRLTNNKSNIYKSSLNKRYIT